MRSLESPKAHPEGHAALQPARIAQVEPNEDAEITRNVLVDQAEITRNVLVDQELLFQRLVKKYKSSLHYFVLKRVGHPDDAADITQQAFASAASSISSYRAESEISTWIFGIANNLAKNHMSRSPQRRYYHVSDDALDACESPCADPCTEASLRQSLTMASSAMATLPVEMAEALTLVAVDGLTDEEYATLFHIARKLFDAGDFQSALPVAFQLVLHSGANPQFAFLAGQCLQALARPGEAVGMYALAIKLDANRMEALCSLGECLQADGRTQDAIEAFCALAERTEGMAEYARMRELAIARLAALQADRH